MFQGVNAGIVAIAPDDLVGISTDRRHTYRSERRQFVGLQNAERIGRLFALFAAAGARAVGAQVLPSVDAAVSIAPFDNQAVGTVFAQR